MECCIADIRTFMLKYQIKINDDKTKVLTIGSRQHLCKLPEIGKLVIQIWLQKIRLWDPKHIRRLLVGPLNLPNQVRVVISMVDSY